MPESSCIAAVLLVLFLGLVGTTDFANVEGDFEFIYHEHHNLLLTINNGTCYFGFIPEAEKSGMDNFIDRFSLEGHMVHLIKTMDETSVKPTTLEFVRDKYQDRLADYHCLDKDVFTVQLYPPELRSVTTLQTTPLQTTTTLPPSTALPSPQTTTASPATAGTSPTTAMEKSTTVIATTVTTTSDSHGHGHQTSPCERPNNAIFECCFGDWCSFRQSTTDNYYWNRFHGEATTPNTGPMYDHSYGDGSGHYVYIDSSGSSRGHVARLISPVFYNDDRSDHCLKFHYHMHGIDVGTLNVYAVEADYPVLNHRVFSVSHDHGDAWQQAQVDIRVHEKFDIAFEATVGGYYGNIAIDDIFLFKGACSSGPGHNTVPTPTTTTTTTHFPGSTSQLARLVGGESPTSGRLELFHNGQWGAVCNDNFVVEEAKVGCRMLGITHGTPSVLAWPEYQHAPSGTPIWMHNVRCVGSERSLWDCPHETGAGLTCWHSMDLGISC